ncbi:MAG: hypothetical protein H0W21_11285 [Actinobacteria bacterium]|nr:hypothetical protein [Actinomycetota bacterium]
MILGPRAGLSIMRENCSSFCYREAAIRGRYAIKLMKGHQWRSLAAGFSPVRPPPGL